MEDASIENLTDEAVSQLSDDPEVSPISKKKEEKMEECPVCTKFLSDLRNLISHLRNVNHFDDVQVAEFRMKRLDRKKLEKMAEKQAEKEEKEAEGVNFVEYHCTVCDNIYESAKSLRRHGQNAHQMTGLSYDIVSSETRKTAGNHKFQCEHCNLGFTRFDYWILHQNSAHSEMYPQNVKQRKFDNKALFHAWFQELQKMSGTSFVIRQSYEIDDKSKVYVYRCHRSGEYESTASVRVPTLTKKLVKNCTAFMKLVEITNVHSIATYCCDHNHVINYSILRFTEGDLLYVKNKIEQKLNDRQIIYDVMRNFSEKDKLYYLTRDDLRNIIEKFNCTVGRFHHDDLKSISIASEQNLAIRKFTPPIDETGDGFVLVFMNNQQEEWIRKYGNRGVLLDDTFNVVKYNLRLTTLLLIDESDKFRPGVFMISFRLRESEVAELFAVVKQCIPSFKPPILISDEAEQFFNGYAKAYPEYRNYTKKLICHYHVLKTWKKNIKKHFSGHQVQQVMSLLYLALKTTNEVEMEKGILKLLSFTDNEESPEAISFSEYFLRNYNENRQQWASCFREGFPFNTSSGVESWHSYLKTHCIGRKRNMRMDGFLVILEEAIEEIEHRRKVEIQKGLSTPHSRMSQTNRNHLIMTREYLEGEPTINKLNGNTFELCLKNGKKMKVKRIQKGCVCMDKMNHCRICGVCSYEFQCNCSGTVPGVACQHCHFVHGFFSGSYNQAEPVSKWVKFTENETLEDASLEEMLIVDRDSEELTTGTDDVERDYEMMDISEETNFDSSILDKSVMKKSDEKHIKFSILQQNLDVVNMYARSLLKSDSDDYNAKLDQICEEVSRLAIISKSNLQISCPGIVSQRSVQNNPKIMDSTMREKAKFPMRKKPQKMFQRMPENIEIDDNDVAYCVICKKKEDGGDESEIMWVGCLNCRLWAHKRCSREADNICYLCTGQFEETEKF